VYPDSRKGSESRSAEARLRILKGVGSRSVARSSGSRSFNAAGSNQDCYLKDAKAIVVTAKRHCKLIKWLFALLPAPNPQDSPSSLLAWARENQRGTIVRPQNTIGDTMLFNFTSLDSQSVKLGGSRRFWGGSGQPYPRVGK